MQHQQRRRHVSVPLPPAWLVFNVFVIALLAGAVWADREFVHWYSEKDRVEELEIELARVGGQVPSSLPAVDSSARSGVSQLDGQVGRVVSLAAISYSLALQERENLGVDATQALFHRCAEWARTGGEFETACR